MRWMLGLIVVVSMGLPGCGPSAFQRHFVPETLDAAYAPIDPQQVRVLELGTQDLAATQARLFPDSQTLGRSAWIGQAGSVSQLREFAASLGADAVLWRKVWLQTHQEYDVRRVPQTRTTRVRTTTSGGQTIETETHVDDTQTELSVDTIEYFEHEVLFLRSP